MRSRAEDEVRSRVIAELKARELAELEADARYRQEAEERARESAAERRLREDEARRGAFDAHRGATTLGEDHRYRRAGCPRLAIGLLHVMPLTLSFQRAAGDVAALRRASHYHESALYCY